jgi:hypothetical protein
MPSRMNLPLMNAVWFGLMILLAMGSSLEAKALEMILKITLISAMGLNWVILSAPGILG